MPLMLGAINIGKNIKTEMAHGRPPKQAVAIALNVAKGPGAKIVGKMLKHKRMKKL